MPSREPIDLERVLRPLKDFQRRSVDYVFDRLYGENPTRRFLLADEVGLGKTLVARGVIARAIEHLRREGVKRIDIVYICSNADIARQNINRLNVTKHQDFELASRITELPTLVHTLESNELNFISFTPGTSFGFGHATGQWRERRLLYYLLRRAWPKLTRGAPAMNLLRANMGSENWRSCLRGFDPDAEIDPGIAEAFVQKLKRNDLDARDKGQRTFHEWFRNLRTEFKSSKRKRFPDEVRDQRNAFIGELRALLAATCVQALEPDLIIMDEFQRFKHLLDPDDPAGSLAHHLFDWGDARALLLSATPYKMYTLSYESANDDHYADFLDTLRFLFNDAARTAEVEQLLADYRRSIYSLSHDGVDTIRELTARLQDRLRLVIARTERLAVTADRSGMLREIENHPSVLKVEHALGYLDTQRVARALDQQDMVEYWKSAPYLLNFMEDYQFKRALKRQVDQGCERELVDAIVASPRAMLSWKEWTRYERIDPVNAQLQAMIDQTLDKGWWRLLWVPPSLPYYQLEGPFADVEAGSVTKRLVFSNWHVVPRAVSALLSYEADRRMVCSFEPGAMNTTEARESRRPLLVFTRTQDRLSGMPVLAMLYPGTVLADIGDPLSILDREGNQRPRTLDDTLALIKADVCQRIAPLIAGAATSGPEDPRWYWAMPILLDARERKSLTRSWFDDVDSLADAWAANEDEGGRNVWREHVREARRVAYGELVPEGRPPKDLADVLALLALAGPGVTALRALARVVGDATMRRRKHVRYGAGRIAWGFRSLFNVPEVISLLRGIDKTEPYWRRVLEYCAHGCLQSTLDEYMHVQREGMGLFDKPPDEAAAKLADAAAAAVGMHVATPGVDEVHVSSDGRTVSIRNHGIRGRFAMRFGQERIDDGEKHFRADQVRQAFNSPFWPFVLVTTSVGQEGLDFHQYCHAVVHWNLPSNPVDLEQREGRVHRYKGHAVRKNIARRHAEKLAAKNDSTDPWHRLFKLACGETGRVSDINPFWVYPIEGGAAIERHVPALPLSRESARLPALRRSLAVYRMVFGQPRQDDLVDYLMHHIEPKRLTQMGEELRIDLTPPGGCDRTSLSSG